VLASTSTLFEVPRTTTPPFERTRLPRNTMKRFIAPKKHGSVVQLPLGAQSTGNPCSFVREPNDHGSNAFEPPR